jgi:hypothetical protein
MGRSAAKTQFEWPSFFRGQDQRNGISRPRIGISLPCDPRERGRYVDRKSRFREFQSAIALRGAKIFRDCCTVSEANPRIARREPEESTSDPLNDDELVPYLGERLDPKPDCVDRANTAR